MNSCTIIISVYNNLDALIRLFWGFSCQDNKNFEIILADDGSDLDDVCEFAERIKEFGLPVTHLWHKDTGFRKAEILNKAILHASFERLIFVDADIIPRSDYVANIFKLLKPNYFISGGSHLHLPRPMHENISLDDIVSKRFFDVEYLSKFDIDKKKFKLRLEKYGNKARFFDGLFPRKNAFVGCNAACWKKDALAVNGFDENWGYGGTDIEFGMRLTNNGVKSRRHSFSLIVLHQEHPRPYRDEQKVKKNKLALKSLSKSGKAKINKGIDGHSLSDVKVVYKL